MKDNRVLQHLRCIARRVSGGLLTTLALCAAVPAAAAATDAPAAAPNSYADGANWLCLPGRDDACATDLTATVVHADGRTEVESFVRDPDAAIDCFYVYPTVSNDPTPNADMNAGPEELAVIRAQFARFGGVCRTFAPLYRQVTLTALRAAIGGAPMAADRALGYGDVVAAWNHYLDAHNDGRGVVLIGHSQGAGVLTELLRREIEGTDAQELLVSVQLIGSRLAVPPGEDVGGALKTIPLCRAAAQTGCVISFASFRDEIPPPEHSRFGRIGGPGSEAMEGMDAACNNPAALAGGRGELDAYLAAGATGIAAGSEGSGARWLSAGEAITTPFVKVPGLLSAECVSDRGFNWLAVRTHGDPADPRTDRIGGDVVGPGGQIAADWGLHLIDMHLAMGNLVEIVARQGEAWLAR